MDSKATIFRCYSDYFLALLSSRRLCRWATPPATIPSAAPLPAFPEMAPTAAPAAAPLALLWVFCFSWACAGCWRRLLGCCRLHLR